jgi:hypothetical protein
MWPFNREPDGFLLYRADGTRHNGIRGDLIPRDTLVIVQDGRYFVRTKERDSYYGRGWIVYREGHKTHEYNSW